MFNLHFPKISDFLCAHTHMRQEHGVPPGGVQHGLLAMMLQLNYLQSFLGKCSSWGYCLWHGVTTWNMGLLFVKSSKNTVLKWSQSIYFDYLLGTQKTLCLGTTCVFRKISFFFRFFAALKVCWKFVANFQSNFQEVASLTETFNANFQGWIATFNANFQG